MRQPFRRFGELCLGHAPAPLLAMAARAVACRSTLALQPGWSFAAAGRATGRRARVRLALWTAFRDRQIQRPVTLHWYDGLDVRAFLGNDLSYCLYVGGSFEPNEFVFLSKTLQSGMVFVDGGANDGLYSLFAARRVGPTGCVVAIEPSAREFARLLENVRLNSLENVTALQVALGASRGSAVLAIASTGHEGQNTIGPHVANRNVETIGHEQVPMWTLDDIVADRGLERVDVVKLDVEGSELRALEGARVLVDRHLPILLIETEADRLESQGTVKAELLDELASIGYRLHVFDAETGQLRPAHVSQEPEGTVVAAPRDWRPPLL